MSGSVDTNNTDGSAALPKLGAAMDKASTGFKRVGEAADKLTDSLGKIADAWKKLEPVVEAAKNASAFEHKLTGAAVTAGLSGAEIDALRTELSGLAVPERTNRSMDELLQSYDALTQAGFSDAEAKALLEPIGRAATATGGKMEDFNKQVIALRGNLGVPPEGMKQALDQVVLATKRGTVEIDHMAASLPELGRAAQTVGLHGTQAVASIGAALETAGKAVEPDKAAAGLTALLQAPTSPEIVAKFQQQGVDLRAALTEALATGGNPLDAILTATQQATGGDPLKLGELFSPELATAILPLLSGMEGYKRLRGELAGASGVVDTGFADMMRTNTELVHGFNNAVDKLKGAVGSALLIPFNAVVKAGTGMVEWLTGVVTAMPGTTDALIGIGSAMVLLPPIFKAVKAAWTVLRVALGATTPIGLAINGLILAAGVLYDNWDKVKEFFGSEPPLMKDPGTDPNDAPMTPYKPPATNDNASNDNGANNNAGQPGAAVAKAEAGAAITVAQARTAASPALAEAPLSVAPAPAYAAASGLPQRVEVVLSLPAGMRAEMRGASEGVTVIARTGQSMVGDV